MHRLKCSKRARGHGGTVAENQAPPIYQGRAGGDPAHTCVLAVALFEGTGEVRLVRKKLLPQDFESRTLGSPNAARDRTRER